ncbi:glycosyltransferase family 2 protein [soil metagenome]
MSVEVIIVNYRSGDVLPACLSALREQSIPHQVMIVDNASGDDSARTIHRAFPEGSILPLRRNVGFARAVNIAASRSEAELIVTLNPDTVPKPNFLEHILAPFVDKPLLGSVAGTLVFASQPDTIASAGISVHRNGVAIDAMLGELHDSTVPPIPVFGASAGAAAYRRDPFLTSGGLAEPFFMYLEDVDLAWRLRLQGYESLWAPEAVVCHHYSLSAGEGSDFKRRLLARNRIWTLARCLPEEIWERDRMRIVAFDAAAFGYSMATLDRAATFGRLNALAGLLPRLAERRAIQSTRTASIDEIDRWIGPAMSPQSLLALRELTGTLAS